MFIEINVGRHVTTTCIVNFTLTPQIWSACKVLLRSFFPPSLCEKSSETVSNSDSSNITVFSNYTQQSDLGTWGTTDLRIFGGPMIVEMDNWKFDLDFIVDCYLNP